MKSRVHPTYKTKYRVKNWASYDRALVRRGDVTVWFSLFISYIAALERHELKLPRLDPFYREHKYCRVDDLFGKGHPPDTVVAMALAYHAFRTGRQPGDYGVTI